MRLVPRQRLAVTNAHARALSTRALLALRANRTRVPSCAARHFSRSPGAHFEFRGFALSGSRLQRPGSGPTVTHGRPLRQGFLRLAAQTAMPRRAIRPFSSSTARLLLLARKPPCCSRGACQAFIPETPLLLQASGFFLAWCRLRRAGRPGQSFLMNPRISNENRQINFAFGLV